MLNSRLEEIVKEFFIDLCAYEQVEIWNEFCGSYHWSDYIHENDPDELFEDGTTYHDVIYRVENGDYRLDDEYAQWQDDGNLVSFDGDDLTDHIDVDELVLWIIRNDTDLVDKAVENIGTPEEWEDYQENGIED